MIWPQSCLRTQPSMTGLSSSSQLKAPSANRQLRVWARGLSFALPKLICAMAVQVVAVDAVARIILAGDAIEHERPGKSQSVASLPAQVALPRYSAPVLPSTLRISSRPSTQAVS